MESQVNGTCEPLQTALDTGRGTHAEGQNFGAKPVPIYFGAFLVMSLVVAEDEMVR